MHISWFGKILLSQNPFLPQQFSFWPLTARKDVSFDREHDQASWTIIAQIRYMCSHKATKIYINIKYIHLKD